MALSMGHIAISTSGDYDEPTTDQLNQQTYTDAASRGTLQLSLAERELDRSVKVSCDG